MTKEDAQINTWAILNFDNVMNLCSFVICLPFLLAYCAFALHSVCWDSGCLLCVCLHSFLILAGVVIRQQNRDSALIRVWHVFATIFILHKAEPQSISLVSFAKLTAIKPKISPCGCLFSMKFYYFLHFR